jgi:hypothetical protein
MTTTTFRYWFTFFAVLASSLLYSQDGTTIRFTGEEYELTQNDSVLLEVKLITDSSEVVLTDVNFTVLPDSLGKFENNVFYALLPGNGWIKATYLNYTDSVKVSVEKAETQENDTNIVISDTLKTVSISRVLPSGKVLPPQVVKEGQAYVIGGLPVPMNILNGGTVFFPIGSLKENISIHIELPEFAKVGNDTVKFDNHKVVNGIAFHVYVGDSLISPYYFEQPLEVAIPFKRGLLKQLNINPARLSLFYASDSLDLDQDGISEVVVDSAANLIRSKAAHFSNLVIAESNVVTSVLNENKLLVDIYPNPVTDNVTITIGDNQKEELNVSIINMMGQKVISHNLDTKTIQLNTNDLAKGMYLIQISTKSNITVHSQIILK